MKSKKIKLLFLFLLLFSILGGCSSSKQAVKPTPTAWPDQPEAPTPTPEPTIEPTITPTPQQTPVSEPTLLVAQMHGEMVLRVQERLFSLGYLPYRPTGYFLGQTEYAIKQYQQDCGVMADGTVGDESLSLLFGYTVHRPKVLAPEGFTPPPKVKPKSYGELLSWEDANPLFADGAEMLIVDLNSDMYFAATRTGGTNHLLVTCKQASDLEKFKAIFSKVETHEKRPGLIEYNGVEYACSIYGMPDSNGKITVYLSGSKSESGFSDFEHDANVRIAANETPAF